ncbi:MAG TPA: CopD family protein [Rhizomicrobium sp.]
MAVVRAVHFLSLMATFGTAAFLTLLRGHNLRGPPEKMVRIFFPAAAAFALVTAALWLVLAAAGMVGDPARIDPAAVRLVASATEFGRIAIWRIGGLAALLALCLSPARARTGVLTGLTALLLASLGLTSHAAAAAGPWPFLRAGNDALHLLTAGFWIGGLVVLAALVGENHLRPLDLSAPFRLFSRWGTPAVTLLVLSGVTNAGFILPLRSISRGNAYADVLAVKITLALGMIILAVVNRLELVPALAGGGGKVAKRLAYSVFAEVLLGALVIFIVGYLGQMAPS